MDFFDFKIFATDPARNAFGEQSSTPSPAAIVIWQKPAETEAEKTLSEFVSKIFGLALKDSEQGVLFLSISQTDTFNLAYLLNQYQVDRAVVFGVEPKRLGMAVTPKHYQVFRLGQRHFIWAHDLNTIFQERQAGKKAKAQPLWEALKKMFELT